jgi:5,10-methylenetetrahydromethanopterin reductase
LSVRDFTELAAAADAAGFDQVWVSHDLFWRSAPVLIAAAAAVTRRVRLGIGIMNPFSAHAAELAIHAATLQELSGGRFLLGVGAGAEEFLAWAGLARPRPLSAAREAVVACRALLERHRPASDGALADAGWQREAHLRWDGPPTPIYPGAMGPKMLALGGQIADGVLGLSFPPERAAHSAAIVRAAAATAGRDPSSVDVPACFWCSIDDDPERAAAPLAEKLATTGQPSQPSGSPLPGSARQALCRRRRRLNAAKLPERASSSPRRCSSSAYSAMLRPSRIAARRLWRQRPHTCRSARRSAPNRSTLSSDSAAKCFLLCVPNSLCLLPHQLISNGGHVRKRRVPLAPSPQARARTSAIAAGGPSQGIGQGTHRVDLIT